MKTSPLLLASLVSTIALVVAVAVFMQEEQGRLPATEAAGNPPSLAGSGQDVESVSKPALREPASAPLPLPDLSSVASMHESEVSDSPVSVVRSSKRETSFASPEIDSSNGVRKSSSEGNGQSIRNFPRWVTRPRGVVLLGAAVSGETSALASNQNPALENHPTPIATRPAKSGQEVKARDSFSPATTITPAARPASAPLSESRGRIPWPRGPFTPEEELYRAQFGAAALSSALREEALGADAP